MHPKWGFEITAPFQGRQGLRAIPIQNILGIRVIPFRAFFSGTFLDQEESQVPLKGTKA
jgi:hypothetical protein